MRKQMMALAVVGCAMGAMNVPGMAQQATNPSTEAAVTTPDAPQLHETPAQRDARLKWWREARFGMFIHWGVYSVPAGTWQDKKIPGLGEWIMLNGKIPVADYAKFAEQFNPTKFDANHWVEMAQNAGVKYIVITAKHHDGFAMFHTGVDNYNIDDATPFKRDPLKELANAAASHGMKLGFYYSQAQDWHHPGGAALRGGHWDKAQDGDYDAYLRNVAVPQVKEILTNYGKVAELWFDTPVEMTPARAAPFLELLKLQPEMVFNNRLTTGKPVGDFDTPEQYVPATGIPGKDWETCMTMNDTWGYKSYDNNWKSEAVLIRTLIDASSKGGNFLLNVGPTSEGLIPQESVERMAAFGKWMKANSEAIYGTSASPFRLQHWGRCTKKIEGDTTKLYLSVFDWPQDGVLNVPVKNGVSKAYLLADPARTVEAKADADAGTVVTLTGPAPDAIASVVVLEMQGKPEVIDQAVRADAKGEVHLEPLDADLKGSRFVDIGQLNTSPARLTTWAKGGTATWNAKLATGTYKVTVNASGLTGKKLTLTIGDKTYALENSVTVAEMPATSASAATTTATSRPSRGLSFQTVAWGPTIEVEKEGPVKIVLKSEDAARDLSVAEIVMEPGK